MVQKAKDLLVRMATEFDEKRRTDFDVMFYLGTPDSIIDEMDAIGYIAKQNDIVGTIRLTLFGYEEAKR